MAASPTKLTRDNTMEVTAKEGIEFLEKADPKLAEKCKEVAQEVSGNGAGDAPEVTKNGDSPTKLTRENTMVTTAEEGKEFLEKQGGVNADAKTRGQEAELNKSVEDAEEKSSTKRAADDQTETEVDDAKKQKTEEVESNGTKAESNGANAQGDGPKVEDNGNVATEVAAAE